MKTRVVIWTIGCVTLLGGAALVALRWAPPANAGLATRAAQPTGAPAEAPRLDRLERELSTLRAAMALLAQEQGAEAAEAEAPKPALEDPAETPSNERADELSVKERTAQREALYDSEFTQEPVDETWSRAKVEAVHAAFRGPSFSALALERADCRYTMCRLQVSLRSQEGERQIAQMWFHDEFRWGGYDRIEGDKAFIWSGREGYPFGQLHPFPRGAQAQRR
jgi:hypothetical protein